MLEIYEKLNHPTQYDFKAIVGDEKWEAYWQDWEKVQGAMKEAQVLADEIRLSINNAAK